VVEPTNPHCSDGAPEVDLLIFEEGFLAKLGSQRPSGNFKIATENG